MTITINLGSTQSLVLAVQSYIKHRIHSLSDNELSLNLTDIICSKEKQKFWILKNFPDAKYIEGIKNGK